MNRGKSRDLGVAGSCCSCSSRFIHAKYVPCCCESHSTYCTSTCRIDFLFTCKQVWILCPFLCFIWFFSWFCLPLSNDDSNFNISVSVFSQKMLLISTFHQWKHQYRTVSGNLGDSSISYLQSQALLFYLSFYCILVAFWLGKLCLDPIEEANPLTFSFFFGWLMYCTKVFKL